MINKLITFWDNFWFREKDLAPISFFRIFFPLILAYFYFSRTFDLAFFYSNSGMLTQSFANSDDMFSMRPSVFYLFDSLPALHFFHAIFLLSLIMLSLGFYTRTNSALAFVLQIMFINRNPTAQYGVDMISSFFFLYLLIVKSGAYYSLDSWLLRRKANDLAIIRSQKCNLLSSVGIRFMQIQLCVIYAYSGFEKLKGVRWWNGSAIWDVFSLGALNRWDLSFIAIAPPVLVIMTYMVVLWEIYFPALICFKKTRSTMLLIGVFFHIGIGIFLNIPSFALLMIATYSLFLTREQIEMFLIEAKKFRRRIRIPKSLELSNRN